MKKTLLITIIGVLILAVTSCKTSEQTQLKKDLSSKPIKMARKEAKQLEKEGYYVAPGALPMDKQLEKAYIKQYQDDEDGYPKYIVATGNSIGETQTAAKIQANATAKLELAGAIQTRIAALIENSIANQQLNNEDAASVTKTVAASKSIIAQELGRVITIVEIYKKIGKNVEASIRIAYDSKTAHEKAKQVIRKSLEEETKITHEKLEKLMDF